MNVLNELRITYFVVSIAMNWWAIFVLQLERLCKNLVLQWRHLQDPPIKNSGYANAWNKTNDKTMETITDRPRRFPAGCYKTRCPHICPLQDICPHGCG